MGCQCAKQIARAQPAEAEAPAQSDAGEDRSPPLSSQSPRRIDSAAACAAFAPYIGRSIAICETVFALPRQEPRRIRLPTLCDGLLGAELGAAAARHGVDFELAFEEPLPAARPCITLLLGERDGTYFIASASLSAIPARPRRVKSSACD